MHGLIKTIANTGTVTYGTIETLSGAETFDFILSGDGAELEIGTMVEFRTQVFAIHVKAARPSEDRMKGWS